MIGSYFYEYYFKKSKKFILLTLKYRSELLTVQLTIRLQISLRL